MVRFHLQNTTAVLIFTMLVAACTTTKTIVRAERYPTHALELFYKLDYRYLKDTIYVGDSVQIEVSWENISDSTVCLLPQWLMFLDFPIEDDPANVMFVSIGVPHVSNHKIDPAHRVYLRPGEKYKGNFSLFVTSPKPGTFSYKLQYFFNASADNLNESVFLPTGGLLFSPVHKLVVLQRPPSK